MAPRPFIVIFLLLTVGLIFVFLSPLAPAGAVYNSPGTGATLTLADIVAADTTGTVGGAWPNYTLAGDLVITRGDTLVIAAGSVITATAGASVHVVIRGGLVVNGASGSPVRFRSSSGIAGSWLGIRLENPDTTSSIAHLAIQDAEVGLELREFESPAGGAAPTIILSHLTVTNCSMRGIDLVNNGSTTRVRLETPSISGSLVGLRVLGGKGPEIIGGSLAGTTVAVDLTKGGAGMILDGVTVTGPGIRSIRNSGAPVQHLASDSILIKNSTFTGNGAETGIALVRPVFARLEQTSVSGYKTGIALERAPGFSISGGTISGCSTGILIFGSTLFARPASITPDFIRLSPATADSWLYSNDAPFDIGFTAPLGFNFPFEGRAYAHQNVGSNGDLLLFESAGQRASGNYSPPGGRGVILDNEPYRTIVWSLSDKLIADSSPHDFGIGWKRFAPGQADADGRIVSETQFVVSWHGTTSLAELDTSAPAPNRHQVILYPDGRIQWNLERITARRNAMSQYSGLSSREEFEIFTDCLTVVDSRSYRWNPADSTAPVLPSSPPAAGQVTGTLVNGVTVSNNTTGILADSGVGIRVVSSTISSNDTGISFTRAARSSIIHSSSFSGNTVMDIANTTADVIEIANSGSPTSSGPTTLTTIPLTATTSPAKTCLMTRLFGEARLLPLLRQARDAALDSRLGRLLIRIYYLA
jgi:hypothetical protein